jgi:hypothetical protein
MSGTCSPGVPPAAQEVSRCARLIATQKPPRVRAAVPVHQTPKATIAAPAATSFSSPSSPKQRWQPPWRPSFLPSLLSPLPRLSLWQAQHHGRRPSSPPPSRLFPRLTLQSDDGSRGSDLPLLRSTSAFRSSRRSIGDNLRPLLLSCSGDHSLPLGIRCSDSRPDRRIGRSHPGSSQECSGRH